MAGALQMFSRTCAAPQEQMLNQLYKVLTEARGVRRAPNPAPAGPAPRPRAPPVDISERKDAYVVTVEGPGVTVEGLDISFQDGLLTIQGQRSPTR